MHVMIIGAGLGGLTLAHGLRTAGIDVTVYERSPRTGPQPASYGIHINDHGNRALHACLPSENWQRYDHSTAPAPNVVRFRDTDLEVLTDLNLDTPGEALDPVLRRRAVRRQELHRALLHGLDDVVHWDKRFDTFTALPDGRVRAEFAGATSVDADLLVAADGSNSRVRQQYLPHLQRQELGILNVAGRLALTDPAARALPPGMTDGSVNNVVPAGPGWMFASTWPAAQTGTEEDFLVWAYAADRNSYPGGLDTDNPPALQHLVLDRIGGWDPRLSTMVAHSILETVAAVPLRTMPTLPSWAPGPVTLLGDAIHNMTPMAGIGANTALRDADTLRRALTEDGSASLPIRVGKYETEMRGYANEALALSTRNARNAASTKRLPRVAFRTLLKVTDAVPPLKRRIFPATAQTAATS